jgi:hypothetical protein
MFIPRCSLIALRWSVVRLFDAKLAQSRVMASRAFESSHSIRESSTMEMCSPATSKLLLPMLASEQPGERSNSHLLVRDPRRLSCDPDNAYETLGSSVEDW